MMIESPYQQRSDFLRNRFTSFPSEPKAFAWRFQHRKPLSLTLSPEGRGNLLGFETTFLADQNGECSPLVYGHRANVAAGREPSGFFGQ